MIRQPATKTCRRVVASHCWHIAPALYSSSSHFPDLSSTLQRISGRDYTTKSDANIADHTSQPTNDVTTPSAHHSNTLNFFSPLPSLASPANASRFSSTLPLHETPGSIPQTFNEPGMAVSEVPFTPLAIPDFNDPKSAHGSKSAIELARAILVYQLCRVQPIVDNAEALMNLSSKVFGNTLTDLVMKATFFQHFCAGEDEKSIEPAIEKLRRHGIGGILDYAAENDGDMSAGGIGSKDGVISQPPYNQPARVYDYMSEHQCDQHVETFLKCIHAVKDVSPEGFAAVKVTALGNPLLLERMSSAITEAKNLYTKFDLDRDGVVTRDEFAKCYRTFFNDADEKLDGLLDTLDPNNSNKVDYIEWSKLLAPSDLPQLTASCREVGPLALATPSEEEIKLMDAMRQRLHALAEEASLSGVRLLIDAEHLKFQPAIDNLTLDLQQKYNATDRTEIPVIFNTYQCYLKDVPERLIIDVERSRRHSYHFATKLVRGAYMNFERERAADMNYPDPIHATLEDTHACYDEAVEYLLRYRAENNMNLEVMCATHNQQSIEKAIGLMNELGIRASDSTVHFAQLYGMSDNLTYTLGRNGFRAYKYVPYGLVHEVMPYLMRRAQENSGMMGGNTSKELDLLHREVKRRVLRI